MRSKERPHHLLRRGGPFEIPWITHAYRSALLMSFGADDQWAAVDRRQSAKGCRAGSSSWSWRCHRRSHGHGVRVHVSGYAVVRDRSDLEAGRRIPNRAREYLHRAGMVALVCSAGGMRAAAVLPRLKSLFDGCAAAATLIMLAPVMAAVAAKGGPGRDVRRTSPLGRRTRSRRARQAGRIQPGSRRRRRRAARLISEGLKGGP
jgi:hypothetical protein